MKLLHEVTRTMSVQFAVLASGSRGNSTLVQGRNGGLLIDAGMGPESWRSGWRAWARTGLESRRSY